MQTPRRVVVAATACAVACALFMLIAGDILAHGPFSAIDAKTVDWVVTHRVERLDTAMRMTTHLHDSVVLVLAAALWAVWLWRRGERPWVVLLAASVGGGVALNAALKLLFHRPRPMMAHASAASQSFSFPSGHTSGAAMLYGFVALYVAVHVVARPGVVRATVVGCAAMVALVGCTRVYLGYHYPSDVIAAALEGMAWVLACWLLMDRWQVRPSG